MTSRQTACFCISPVVRHRQLLFSVTFGLQYGIPFYLQYLAHWPEYFIVAEAPGGELMGYSKFVSLRDDSPTLQF